MTRATRVALIILLTLVGLTILRAAHTWELAHPRSQPTHGSGYGLATLLMVAITAAALLRRRQQ